MHSESQNLTFLKALRQTKKKKIGKTGIIIQNGFLTQSIMVFNVTLK